MNSLTPYTQEKKNLSFFLYFLFLWRVFVSISWLQLYYKIQFCFLLWWKDVSSWETADSGLLDWSCPVTGQLGRPPAHSWHDRTLPEQLPGARPCWVLGGRVYASLPWACRRSAEEKAFFMATSVLCFGVENLKHISK